MQKRLEKSKNNHFLGGVLAGIGEYFGLDENAITILRIVYAVLALMSMGSLILIYAVLYFVIPDPKKEQSSETVYHQSQARDYATTGRKMKEAEPVKEDDWSDF